MATITSIGTKAETWTIDPAHSSVDFAVKHMMIATVRGHLGPVSGTVVLDESNYGNSKVDVTIDVTGLSTNEANRDAHLLSADFFDTEKYPTAAFESKSVQAAGKDRFKVVGDLTIKDVTREITIEVEREGVGIDPWGATKASFAASTTINRKDFGLNWNVALETGGVLVSESVKLELNIQAAKQAAVTEQAA